MIRGNPASRGTETSAEVLVGPPWRMESNAGVNSSGTRLTAKKKKKMRDSVCLRFSFFFRPRGGKSASVRYRLRGDQLISENPASFLQV